MDIIDNDKKTRHSKLAEGVENAIQVQLQIINGSHLSYFSFLAVTQYFNFLYIHNCYTTRFTKTCPSLACCLRKFFFINNLYCTCFPCVFIETKDIEKKLFVFFSTLHRTRSMPATWTLISWTLATQSSYSLAETTNSSSASARTR